MSTDRELLELAAKAAKLDFVPVFYGMYGGGGRMGGEKALPYRNWNPLTDDGDGARLEAALEIYIVWWPTRAEAVCVAQNGRRIGASFGYVEAGGKQAARRLASLRVAAEIGRAMP